MALTKRTEVDEILIEGGVGRLINVRTAEIISEDGVDTHRGKFSRIVIKPDTSMSGISSELQAIAAAVHTAPVKQAWEDKKVADALKANPV